MKKTIKIKNLRNKEVSKTLVYIPTRYVFASLLTIFEVIFMIAIVIFLTLKLPYFWIAVAFTQVASATSVILRDDNPDYKVPWLVLILCVPIVGFMLYFIFYSRKLKSRFRKKIKKISEKVEIDDSIALSNINNDFQNNVQKNNDNELKNNTKSYASNYAYSQAIQFKKIADAHVYQNTDIKYYASGESSIDDILSDLKDSKKFIFLEYFIIEGGFFWDRILKILKNKAKEGLDVRVVYDDIGCMTTLPGNYYRKLEKLGIKSTPYSRLRVQADNEFNNRNHRKIMVIDGQIAYTGGINIADEYINRIKRFGYWKDTLVRLNGEAVNELTTLFLMDFSLNYKKADFEFSKFMVAKKVDNDGFVIPFGDGPKPLYQYRVGKTVIMNMLNQAKKYVYMETPYLIIDNELCQAIENTALRGIDVRIILPFVPDKKISNAMAKSHYKRLINAGVKIYEYKPGFIHAKVYLSDDEVAIVGTINLDYRSLVHHFENGVWIYKHSVINDIKKDVIDTLDSSIHITKVKEKWFNRLMWIIFKIVSPLL